MKNLPLLLTLIGLSLTCGCHRNAWLQWEGERVKDFDVVGTKDLNGLPLNPQWGQQTRRTRPGEQNTLPDPCVSCPCQSYDAIPFDEYEELLATLISANEWTNSSKYPNCTSFPVSFTGSGYCGPHVNFEPVTYAGVVTWDGKGFDDDYLLNVKRPDSALYSTIASRVHIEFDSDETVDNWDDTGTWWNRFHHDAVDHYYEDGLDAFGHTVWVYDGDAQASAMINGSSVIVIGMLNLDGSHNHKTEIHPVYAMFVQHLPDSDCDGTRSCWAFFVRNWGDEGFCSDDDQPFETQKIKIIIPNVAGLISENVWDGAQNADEAELSPMQVSMEPSGEGVLLTFNLLPPNKQSWFVGDYTFVARITTPVTPRPTISTSAAAPAPQGGRNPSGETEPEERLGPDLQALEARIAKLPADSRIELYRQLQYLTPRKKSSPVKTVVLFEPAKDEHVHPSAPAKAIQPRTSRPSGSKSTVALHRQKKIEFIKQYLAEKEKKTQ